MRLPSFIFVQESQIAPGTELTGRALSFHSYMHFLCQEEACLSMLILLVSKVILYVRYSFLIVIQNSDATEYFLLIPCPNKNVSCQ